MLGKLFDKPFYAVFARKTMEAQFFYDDLTPQRSLGLLLRRIGKLSSASVQSRLSSTALKFPHWVALVSLQYGVVDNCAALARSLGHDSGATTRLVDQLEERGLIERCRGCGDRRVVVIALTDVGRAELAAVTPTVVEYWNSVLADFSRQDADNLISLLNRLLVGLETATLAAGEPID